MYASQYTGMRIFTSQALKIGKTYAMLVGPIFRFAMDVAVHHQLQQHSIFPTNA
jgi:hypothetical protein